MVHATHPDEAQLEKNNPATSREGEGEDYGCGRGADAPDDIDDELHGWRVASFQKKG